MTTSLARPRLTLRSSLNDETGTLTNVILRTVFAGIDLPLSVADPGFDKEGGAPKIFLDNLGDFLKNFAQKVVGVHTVTSFLYSKAKGTSPIKLRITVHNFI